MKSSLVRLFFGAAVISAMAFFGCQQVTQIPTTSSVIGQVNGRLVDDLGQPIAGATIVYNAPEASLSRAITSVTSDTNGYFTVAKLQTGIYTFKAVPKTATNMIKTFTATIKTLAELNPAESKTIDNVSQVVDQGNIVLPRLGGAISGSLFQAIAISGGSVPTIVASRTLAIDFSAYNLYFPDTGKQHLTATTDAAGAFSFANLPMMKYGGSSAYPGGTANPVTVCLDSVYQVSSNTTSFTLPAIDLGINGQAATVKVGSLVATAAPLVSLALVGSNLTIDATSVSAPITLYFNNKLSAATPASGALTAPDGSTKVLATLYDTTHSKSVNAAVAVSDKTLTITPTTTLLYNTKYTVAYAVTDDYASTLSNSFIFTTVQRATAPTKVADFAIDSTNFGTASLFNYGTSTYQVTFTYNADYSYTPYYCVTENGSTVEVPWSKGTISYRSMENGKTAYATLGTTPTWYSGQTLKIKLVESYADASTIATTDSDVISITDKIAPTSASVSGYIYDTYYGYWTYRAVTLTVPSTANGVTDSVSLIPNWTTTLSATSSGVYYFTMQLAGEYIGSPTITLSSYLQGKGVTAEVYLANATTTTTPSAATPPTVMTVTLKYPAGVKSDYTSGTGKDTSLVIKAFDAAGNQYVGSGSTKDIAVTLTELYN